MNDNYANYGIELDINAKGQHYTTCPKCSHLRKKSGVKCLGIDADKGIWNCNHCGWSGSLKTEKYHEVKKVYEKPENIERSLSEKVIEYFANRKISIETLDKFNITTKKEWMPQSQKEENCIVFPYFRDGQIVNYKFRSGKKHFKQSKNAEKIFFNLDSVEIGMPLIITEGEIDAMTFHQCGFMNVISVPDGAPSLNSKNFENKFLYIENCYEELKDVDNFIIATDSDEPGIKLRDELSRRLGRERCKIINYPDDCKDVNEVLINYGQDRVQSLLNDAEDYPIDGVYKPSYFYEKLFKYHERGEQPGYSTGFAELDKHYTVRTGEMTIWTGYTGHGKSEFLDQLLINLAYQYNFKIGVCSLENLPYERHISKLITKYCNDAFSSKNFFNLSKKDVQKGIGFIDEYFRFFQPDDLTVDNLLEIAKQMIFRFGINGFVLDPWNELEHRKDKNQSETDYISEFLTKIRRFARINDIHIWVVAHPTKPIKGKKLDIPSLYDISGSANWANKADNGVSVFRNMKNNFVTVESTKIRFKEIGTPGKSFFTYDINSGKYSPTNQIEIEKDSEVGF